MGTITAALKIMSAAQEAANLAARAIEAANNGNEEEAKEYLEKARSRYAASRDAWDNA